MLCQKLFVRMPLIIMFACVSTFFQIAFSMEKAIAYNDPQRYVHAYNAALILLNENPKAKLYCSKEYYSSSVPPYDSEKDKEKYQEDVLEFVGQREFIHELYSAVAYQNTLTKESSSEIIKKALCTPNRDIFWGNVKKIIKFAVEKDNTSVDTTESKNEGGHTPLSLAVYYNDLAFTKYFLSKGANPNIKITYRQYFYPIFFARSIEVLSLLEEYKADIHVVDSKTNLALHALMLTPFEKGDLIQYCVEKKCNFHAINAQKSSAWHILLSSWHDLTSTEVLRRANVLKELNVNPYTRDILERTAMDLVELHIRSQEKYKEYYRYDSFRSDRFCACEIMLRKVKAIMEQVCFFKK